MKLMLGDPFSESNEGLVNWDIHARALGKLLQLRGIGQFDSKIVCQLFQLSYHNIVRSIGPSLIYWATFTNAEIGKSIL